jgi:dihydrofolate reductase
MAKLSFQMMASLDGFVSDLNGGFDWGQIDDEVHAHANREARGLALAICGRAMYETMVYWETHVGSGDPVEDEFAQLWQGLQKIVVSSTLEDVVGRNTKLVPRLGNDEMRALKEGSEGEISVSGPRLAAGFLDAGLVDEVSVYSIPVVAGQGRPMFRNLRFLDLERIETIAFANGVTFLRYRVRH